jgi:ribonuclease P protein subunit POP4
MINKNRNTFPHELIGKEVVVVTSTNPHQNGIKGKIIDETKQTLKIKCNGEIKTLLKSNLTIKVDKFETLIRGKDLLKRPEERLK